QSAACVQPDCNRPYYPHPHTPHALRFLTHLPPPPQIRLTGGRTRYEGRVEVLSTEANGTRSWGLICGGAWGTKEAMVVCRQLGLGYANHGLQETWYWDSSNVTEMVMSGVKCTGRVAKLPVI
uniref:SRCR domain-containing protein n=1 Tax=Hucho hucho TaxID=62062 RepID=A0A4W5KTY9_9TELE